MFFKYRIIAAAPILLVLSSLSACGQKGPLFLTPQSVPYKLLPSSPTSAPSAPAAVVAPSPSSPASAAK